MPRSCALYSLMEAIALHLSSPHLTCDSRWFLTIALAEGRILLLHEVQADRN